MLKELNHPTKLLHSYLSMKLVKFVLRHKFDYNECFSWVELNKFNKGVKLCICKYDNDLMLSYLVCSFLVIYRII